MNQALEHHVFKVFLGWANLASQLRILRALNPAYLVHAYENANLREPNLKGKNTVLHMRNDCVVRSGCR
jgi:hypothetical protein